MRHMTKREALKYFREEIAPLVRQKYGRGDVIAMREAWNDWTDSLAKDGHPRAYHWDNPF